MQIKHKIHFNSETLQKSSSTENIYQSWVSFKIIEDCGSNLYDLQKFDDSNGWVQRYKCTDICLLPQSVYLHEPLHTTDKC